MLSCVPYSQQVGDRMDQEIARSYKGIFVTDTKLFQSRIAIESECDNTRYRSILDRSLVRLPTTPTMKIYKDFLLFHVRHIGCDPNYQLIWNGLYEVDSAGRFHAYLIYNHKAEQCRIYTQTFLGFDLTLLRTPKTDEIILHFMGIEEVIPYRY